MSFKKVIFTFLVAAVFTWVSGYGQTHVNVADTIDKKFAEILDSSPTYQTNKVVKIFKITDLRVYTGQQIRSLEGQIVNLNQNLETQIKAIDSFENELADIRVELEAAEKAKNEFATFGTQIEKGVYQQIVYGIIGLLILLLAFFIYRFFKSLKVTRETKRLLENAENEFEDYRQTALETQQRLGRQLQDERMKNTQKDTKK